jgi:hypothetical protein
MDPDILSVLYTSGLIFPSVAITESTGPAGNILYSSPNCSRNSRLNARNVTETGSIKTDPIYGIINKINPQQHVIRPQITIPIAKRIYKPNIKNPYKMKCHGCLPNSIKNVRHASLTIDPLLYMMGTTKLLRNIQI